MRSLAYATGGVRQKQPSPRSLGGGGVSCRGYPSGATGQPGTAVEMRAPVKYSPRGRCRVDRVRSTAPVAAPTGSLLLGQGRPGGGDAADSRARRIGPICGGSYRRKQVTMSRSGILDALRNEEQSLRRQLVAHSTCDRGDRRQRPAGRPARQEEGRQGGRQTEACDDRGAAQGGRRADARLLGLPASGQGAGREGAGVTLRGPAVPGPGIRARLDDER